MKKEHPSMTYPIIKCHSIMLSLLLVFVLAVLFPIFADASAAHTRDESVNWAIAQIGKGLDYDNMYGNQCVDLIKYYYDYLGHGGYARGNAYEYKTNALPPGWVRVYGGYQPGDVAVWKTNHVAIITSADSVGFNAVNQNFNYTPYCTQNWFKLSVLECAIRPDFKVVPQDTQPPVISNVKVYDVTADGYSVSCTVTDNAGVARVRFPSWNADIHIGDHAEWLEGTINGNTASVRVNIAGLKSGAREGHYMTHIYAYDAAGNSSSSNINNGQPLFIDRTPPEVSGAYIKRDGKDGYWIWCKVTDNLEDNIDRVQFPSWTLKNGQDDLVEEWWINPILKGAEDGDNYYKIYVDVKDHNNEMGSYRNHLYAYDKYGNYGMCNYLPDVEFMEEDVPPVILSKEVSYPNANTVHIKITAEDNVGLGELYWNVEREIHRPECVLPADGIYEFDYGLKSGYVAALNCEVYDKGGNKTEFKMFLGEPRKEITLKAGGKGYPIEDVRKIYPEVGQELLVVHYYEGDFIKVENKELIPLKTGVTKCAFSDGNSCWTKTALNINIVDRSTVSINKKQAVLSKAGASETLTAEVEPVNVRDKTVSWSSSDPSVATVDQSGKVTARKNGTVVIIAESNEDGQKAECTVIVNIPQTEPDNPDNPEPPLTPTYYTVKFQKNGGTKLSRSKVTVQHSKTIGILPKVQRKGYTLKGWYTAKSGGKKVSASTRISKSRTFYAQWSKVKKPGRVTALSVKKVKKGKMKITYKKVSGASGYEIAYSSNSKFSKYTTYKVNVKSVSKTLSGLGRSQTYYVCVRAYKLDSAGNKVYGNYSAKKKVRM